MRHVPKIDRPCPLSATEMARIDGHCHHCSKTVHCLDELDDAARRALLQKSAGPICVRYRAPHTNRRVAAIGAVAFSASLAGFSAMAGEHPATASPSDSPSNTTAHIDDDDVRELDGLLFFVGGIEEPDQAEWIDVSTLALLPVVIEAESDE